jgi:type IV pilus assembly protein PilV
MRHNYTQHGFSLIEVLVTLVLVAIGILGMVALQGRSIQYTQDAVQRNVAVTLVNDLTEIIRSNPDAVFTAPPTATTPYYGELKSSSPFYKGKSQAFDPAPGNCVALPKTAAEQLDCWVATARRELPGDDDLFSAHTYICRSSAKGDCDGKGSMLEIQLAWRVKPGACPDERVTDDTVCIYRTRVEL